MKLSKRSDGVKTSPTLALAAKAIELRSKGVDVVSLSVGEPDWTTFEVCKTAGLNAVTEGKTKYTPASGTATLKSALSKKFSKRYGFELNNKNVVITPGAKYAIQEALWNLLNPGDKVGIFIPFWASYTTMVEIANGVPELISLNEDLSLSKENLEKALASGVKVLLINSPNNPSGSAFNKKDYEVLVECLKAYPDVQVILDDIYADLYWGEEGECPHLFDVDPSMFERTIVINGASKAYSMTGWRIGWAIGGADIVGAISRYQSQTTGCPNAMAQAATEAGVEKAGPDIEASVKTLKARAEKGYELLSSIEGVNLQKPKGAFYFWVNLSEVLEKMKMTDSEFCNQLLEKKAVVVVPGVEFGRSGFARMSFAVSEEVFAEGVSRIKEFIKELV
ncbi:MAG: pyridoxal phosphate-dependent aminotransferase [Bdellovibrionales bacterium]